MNNQTISEYQEDEIDLKQLFRSLADRKWFIFGFTSFITVLAVAYAVSIPPTYKANISFLSPNQSSVLQLNKTKLSSETSETIYRQFLNNLISSKSQNETFVKNNYLNRLNFNNELIADINRYIGSFTQSIQIESVVKSKKEVVVSSYEKPIVVTMEGNNPEIISDFLNDLSVTANKKTIDEFLAIIKQKINIRLDEISEQRELLLTSAKNNRLSKIERMKIEDSQKINEINDQIDRLRIKSRKDRLEKIKRIENDDQLKIAKLNDQIELLRVKTKNNRLDNISRIENDDQLKIAKLNDQIELLRVKAEKDRLNKIQRLTDAILIAGELGIIDNNFKKVDSSRGSDSSIIIEIDKGSQKFPEWYLYGKKALSKEVSILKNRINDDPYIKELVGLQNQIETISNNKDLLNLKNRINDDPYIKELVGLQNQIEVISNDKDLLDLKNRTNDDPYIKELVGLQNQIEVISNDKDLLDLKNRTNDDPYVPEIITLQNELILIKSNQTLQTLESRKDDSPFIAEINKLDIESIKLKSFKPSSLGVNAMQINQPSYPLKSSIKPKRRLIVSVALIAGFILSILLVFIMNAFRSEKE